MTNEEMAQVLDNHAADARIQEKCCRVASSDLDDLAEAEEWQRRAEAFEAGAAALRREEWRDGLPTNPERNQHYMVWRTDVGIFAAEYHVDEEDGIGRWFSSGGLEDLSDDLPTKHLPIPEPPEGV